MSKYHEIIKLLLWNELKTVPGYDEKEWRKDCQRNILRYSHYGDQKSLYGWHIDHIRPLALGGSNHISNLRALHWRVNTGLGGVLGRFFK